MPQKFKYHWKKKLLIQYIASLSEKLSEPESLAKVSRKELITVTRLQQKIKKKGNSD